MKKDSKIYVAGHRGLVGSAILRRLQSQSYSNLILRTHQELDLEIQKDVNDFFEVERPEYVFLAAAKVGGIYANNTYPADFIYNNLIIEANVIHAAYKYGVKKLLFLGSSCIYPRLAPQPMKEEYLLSGPLEPTNEPYAIAKIAGIKLCQSYNRQYRTNFISVMPTNLYGPNDNFDLETSHVLTGLIRKFHLAKLLSEAKYDEITRDLKIFGNTPHCLLPTNYTMSKVDIESQVKNHLSGFGINSAAVTIWGTGEPYRDFLYIDDLSEACVFLMENYDYNEICEFINIGTGNDLKIKDLAKLIKEIVGFYGEIKYDLLKPDGTPRKLLDVSKIKSIGWVPKVSMEEGIKRTYRWYCLS